MRKKIPAFFIAILLVLQNAVSPAAAAGAKASLSVISACYINNRMYCYVVPNDPDMDISGVSIGAVSTDFQGGEMQSPQTVAGSACAVKYMLLIDTSTSMPAYRQKLIAFADALLEEEQQETTVTVAGFGDSFEIIKENLSDPEQVRQAIEKISYEQEVSDISGGVVEAIDYLSAHAGSGGEICNLIVLTDGETYLSGTGTGRSGIKKAADEAKEVISSTPEVVVHTVGLGQWESLTYGALSSGTGVDLSVRSNNGASEAGGLVAQFVDGLYYVNIPFTSNQNVEYVDAQLMLTFDTPEDLEFIPLDHLRNMNFVGGSEISGQPDDGAGSDAPSKPEDDPPGDDPETEEDVPQDAGETPEENTPEEDGDASEEPGTQDAGDPDETDPASGEEESDDEQSAGTPWVLIAVGAVAAVIAALLIGVMLGRRRNKGPVSAPREEDGIWIRLELLSNNAVAGRLEYPIGSGLVIGSDSSCDIVFPEETVSARNSRIYMRGGTVYIEDMNRDSNTSVGGMKLHMPNRLRDGDEVSTGSVRFRVRFLNND